MNITARWLIHQDTHTLTDHRCELPSECAKHMELLYHIVVTMNRANKYMHVQSDKRSP